MHRAIARGASKHNQAGGTYETRPLADRQENASIAGSCSKRRKRQGSEPTKTLRRAGDLLMESFWDQTARATASRKALRAETAIAAPSPP